MLNKNMKINQNWLNTWENKSVKKSSDTELLSQLIEADGYSGGAGSYSEKEWRKMCKHFGELIGLSKSDKILEIGCGSGAFLLVLKEYFQCQIYGVDYSDSLIKIAKKHLSGEFIHAEAIEPDKFDESFDFIVSNSVFQYFPSIDYACMVIQKSSEILRDSGVIAILDINDKSKEGSYHSSRKLLHSNPESYDLLYKDHPHLFYSKQEIINMLTDNGFHNIQFFDHYSKSYENAKFRFNVIAEKKDRF